MNGNCQQKRQMPDLTKRKRQKAAKLGKSGL